MIAGCGVSGLTCGLRLLDSGFQVELRGRERPRQTTSAVAAAIWYPYKAGPVEAVARWAGDSYQKFRELSRDPSTGVALLPGIELLAEAGQDAPWRRELAGLRAARAQELPTGHARGFAFEAPVAEMPIYLGWLESRLRAQGARIRVAEVRSLDELAREADLVVDCAGLGARALAADPALVAVRGQVVRVERAGIERFLLDDYNPAGITYVVPRSQDCVLGGSAQEGREDLEVDPSESEAIRARCRALEPRLERAAVLGVDVGLRPWRPQVRLEAERLDRGRLLVHDYGHGGAGVTLSWGCANEVARLAAAAFPGVAGSPGPR